MVSKSIVVILNEDKKKITSEKDTEVIGESLCDILLNDLSKTKREIDRENQRFKMFQTICWLSYVLFIILLWFICIKLII